MADNDDGRMEPFRPDDLDSCAAEWEAYKRAFLIHLDAKGLHIANGRQKVGQLLKLMGRSHIATYDTFTWLPAVPAVEADEDRGIEAQAAIPAQDRYNIDHVFAKFDEHFGVHRFRSIKRQEFLSTVRGEKQSVMGFIAELKRKAEYCDYGDTRDSMICDMIINRINDSRCTERLMELPDAELTVNNVTRVCRQVELTKSHVETLNKEKNSESQVNYARRGGNRGSSRSRGNRRGSNRSSRHRSQEAPYCNRCCQSHNPGYCKAYEQSCNSCGNRGHFRRSQLCPNNRRGRDRGHQRGRGYQRDDRGYRRDDRGYQRDNRGHHRGNRGYRRDNRGYHRGNGYGNQVHKAEADEYELFEKFEDCSIEDIYQFEFEAENSDACVVDANDVCAKKDVNDVKGNTVTKCCEETNVEDVENITCVENLTCVVENVPYVDENVPCVDKNVDDVDKNDDEKVTCSKDENVTCVDAEKVACDDAETVTCADDDKHETCSDVENGDKHDENVENEMMCHNANDVCYNVSENDWSVDMEMRGKTVKLEIDTGARCNLMCLSTVQKLGLEGDIQKSNVRINGVHGNVIKAYGVVKIPCVYKDKTYDMTFQVLNGKKDLNLIGRDDSVRTGLVVRVNKTDTTSQTVVNKYRDVLGTEIGCLPKEYDIVIDESVTPVVHPPRSLPAAIRDKVKEELERLEKCGIITKVTKPTPWVNSLVVVKKKNNRVRICIDPRDLNKAVLREHYPMNSIEDIATRLRGSTVFSTLDANSGYFQLKLTEKSSDLTTFNTPFGRFKYLRMPMGIKCAAEIFQREMATSLSDLEGVEVVVDDLLVHGRTQKEHDERLTKVLERARKLNLKLSIEKSKISKKEIDYVGHKITAEGLKPTEERVQAISNMKTPENVQELETILGMVAYVSKFIPNVSDLCEPLREVKKAETWLWGPEQDNALERIKQSLTSETVLRFYDVKKPIRLTVDASMKGLGAALIQENGVIAYASRALTTTEQKYAQIEKEALAIVFGCTKFHKMLYGKTDVTVESDHKPLETIWRKPIHSAPMRIQRMLLKLQPYEFKLVHVDGKSIGLADCLSRFPVGEPDKQLEDDLMICPADTFAGRDQARIAAATQADRELQELRRAIIDGWPHTRSEVPASISAYWDYRDELSTYNGIVYKGDRIVIPRVLRGDMVKRIHKAHLGMVTSKQRARDLIFWPGMNSQIEDTIRRCEVCLKYRNKQPKEPMTAHDVPNGPWKKVASDIFELYSQYYIVLVDYYSNFIEVERLDSLSTSSVIKFLKRNIARYGLMEELVSDNGPQYTSQQFQEFMKQCDIQHTTSSPLHPQSNGLAEKAVQTIKMMMKKCREAGDDFHLALLDLRNTPRDQQTGSPAQRLMGRRTKTLLPTSDNLLKPGAVKPETVKENLEDYRMRQKHYYDRGTREMPPIKPGSAIRVHTPEGWMPAELLRRHELPKSYVVKAGSQARNYRRNRNMIMQTTEKPHSIKRNTPPFIPTPRNLPRETPERARNNQQEPIVNVPQPVRPTVPHPAEPTAQPQAIVPPEPPDVPRTTRSGRIVRKPAWMRDMVVP